MLKPIAIAIASAGLAAALLGVGLQHNSEKNRTEKISDQTVPLNGAAGFRLKVPIGSAKVIAGNFPDIQVHVVRWFKRGSDATMHRWMDDSTVEIGRDGDAITITDHHPKDDHKTIEHDSADLGVEYVVNVPTDLKADVRLSAGDVNISGRYSQVSANVSAGDLTADLSGSPQQDSRFNVSAGDLSLHLGRSVNAKVKATVSVGEISGLPGNSTGRTKMINLGDSRTVQVGSGGKTISANVSVGDLTVKSDSGLSALESSQDQPTVEALKSDKEKGDADDDIEINMPKDFDKDMDKAFDKMGSDLEKQGKDLDKESKDLDKQSKEIDERAEEMANKAEDMADVDIDLEKLDSLKDIDKTIDKALAEAADALHKASNEADKHRDSNDRLGESIAQTVAEAIRESADALAKVAAKVKVRVHHHIKRDHV